MAKKTDLKTDYPSFDDGLDFNFEDDMEGGINQEALDPKSRSVVSNTLKGVKSGVKDTLISPAFIKSTLEKSLPKTYGEITEGLGEITAGGYQLYDETVRELKPRLGRITKKIDSLIPEGQKTLKKISAKMMDLTGAERDSEYGQTGNQEEQAITQALSAVFEQQKQYTQDAKVKEVMNGAIESKRFASSSLILRSIEKSTSTQAQYTVNITQRYQRKMLELQLRGYLAQTSYYTKAVQHQETSKAQLEAITKNTSLPEFAKITNFERIKDAGKQRFANSLYGDGSMLQKGLSRLKETGKQFIGGMANRLDQTDMSLDGALSGKEALEQANEMLTSMGEPPLTKAEMAGSALAGNAIEFLRDVVAKRINAASSKNPKITENLAKLSKVLANPAGAISNLRGSQDWQDKTNDFQSKKGAVYRFADFLLDHFTEGKESPTFKGSEDLDDLDSPTKGFDRRAHLSLVDVIPGHLAAIHREIAMMRTGRTDIPLQTYDFEKKEFVSKKEMGDRIFAKLEKETQRGAHTYYARTAAESFMGDASNLTEDQKAEVQKFIFRLSHETNKDLSGENVKDSMPFRKLSPEIQAFVKKKFDDMESADDKEVQANRFTRNIMKVRETLPGASNSINRYVKAGYGDVLAGRGLLKRDEDGDYKTDEAAYSDFLEKNSLIRSDVNVKEAIQEMKPEELLKTVSDRFKNTAKGIKSRAKSLFEGGKPAARQKPTAKGDIPNLPEIDHAGAASSAWNPKAAYEGFKKTKLYNWFYKNGKGDDQPHSGPMSQDVKKNFGEKAAPGGKTIDLQSMNGATMAAIKHLGAQIEKLGSGGRGKNQGILFTIRQDTAEIVKILKSRKGSGPASRGRGRRPGPGTGEIVSEDAGYKEMMGATLSNIVDLAVKVSGDVYGAASRVFATGRDKVAKPTLDFISKKFADNKDGMKASISTLFTKASNLAGGVLDFGKNLLTKQLPAGLKSVRDMGKRAYDAVAGQLNKVRDLYTPDGTEPIIRAIKMRAGAYRDSITGEVLDTIDKLMAAKGDIVDSAGNIILSVEEKAKGLYDMHGEKVKSTIMTAVNAAVGAAGYVKDQVVSGLKALKMGSGPAFDRVKGLFKGKVGEMGFSGGNKYAKESKDILVDIRDIMLGDIDKVRERLKAKAPKKPEAASGEGGEQTITEEVKTEDGGAPGAPEARYTGGGSGVFSKFKNFASGKLKSVKDRFAGKSASEAAGVVVAGATAALEAGKEKATDQVKKLTQQQLEQKARNDYINSSEFVGPIGMNWNDRIALMVEDAKTQLRGGKPAEKPAATGSAETPASATPAPSSFMDKLKAKRVAVANKFNEVKDRQKYQSSDEFVGPRPQSVKEKSVGLFGRLKGAMAKPAAPAADFVGPMPKAVSKKDKLLGGAKMLGGKARGLFGSALGMLAGKGEAAPADPNASAPEATKTEAPKKESLIKRIQKRLSPKDRAWNDKDGNGERDGGVEERARKQEEDKAARAKNTPEADLRERYKGGNLLGGIMDKLTGMLSFLGKGFGSLFSIISGGLGGILKMAPAAMGALGSVAGKVLKGGVKGIVKGAFQVGKFALTRALPTMLMGSLSLAGSAIGAVGGAIASAVASPVVLGVGLAALAGYGIYKLYKYATRNNANEFERIRLRQYGFGYNSDVDQFNHHVYVLEAYLQDGRVGYEGGKAYILDKKIKPEELLEIFEIDKEDKETAGKFTEWFKDRFKPVFLTHLTALYALDDKIKLDAVYKLEPEKQVKYLNATSFESGPYDVTTSPLKALATLSAEREPIKESTKNLIEKIRAEAAKSAKKIPLPAKPLAEAVTPKDAVKPAGTTPDGKDAASALKAKEAARQNSSTDTSASGTDGETQPRSSADGGNKSATPVGGAGAGSSIPMAPGGPLSGERGRAFLKLGKGVNIDGIHPSMLKNFLAMAEEFGKPIPVNSGSRTYAQQDALHKADPKKAAKPGKSLHEFGIALDIDSATANELEKAGLMKKYGFTRPVGGEPWHVEPAGIQRNIPLAVKDEGERAKMIEASLFRGGGGYGTLPNAVKYKRNDELANSLLNLPARATVAVKDDKSKTTAADKVLTPDGDKTAPGASPAAASLPDAKAVSMDQKTNATAKTAANDAAPTGGKEKQSEDRSTKSQLPSPNELALKQASSDGEAKPATSTGAASGDTDLKQTIAKNAQKAGVDPNLMQAFAAVESGMDPQAKSKSSTASGLFQFISSTWNEVLGKFGSKYGLDKSASPFDPTASTLLASEYVKQNQRAISSVKPEAGLVDMYLTHFLGPGGAKRFLALAPDAIAADAFPGPANSNRGIFYDSSGRALTAKGVYDLLTKRLAEKSSSFGIKVSGGQGFKGNASKPGINPTAGVDSPIMKPMAGETVSAQPKAQTSTPTRTEPTAMAGPSAAEAPKPKESPSKKRSEGGGVYFDQRGMGLTSSGRQEEGQAFSGPNAGKVESLIDKSVGIQQDSLDMLRQIFQETQKVAVALTAAGAAASKGDSAANDKPSIKEQDRRNMGRKEATKDSSLDMKRKVV